MFKTICVAAFMAGSSATSIEAPVEAVSTAMPQPWAAEAGSVIDFTVLRKGKPFGHHRLTFSNTKDGNLKVTSDVDLDVKLGPVSLFKFRLDSEEVWSDGQLLSLTGQSNNNGRRGKVKASQQGDTLRVDSTKFDGAVEAGMIPSSHWNIQQVYSSQMLSTETGEILEIEVENLGRTSVDVGGVAVPATHYRLKSDMTVDLWYDDTSRWVKLSFEARGDTIEYVLNALY